MKKIKVDKVILYYMDRVDPDGNLYRFYVYKGMASEIEYFCTEKAGNMTIPIGEGEYVKIVPKEIEKIPVRGYRKLTGIWNRETCNGKGWYRLFNYFKYKPTLCYFKKAGHDENGNTRYEISLFNSIINVTRYFNLGTRKTGCDLIILGGTNCDEGGMDWLFGSLGNENFYICQPLSFYKSQREIEKVNPLYAFKLATAYFRGQGMVPVFEDCHCRLVKL